MSGHVKVTTRNDDFVSFEYERVLVELSKDGDSPNCPNSWTWGIWFDGDPIDATSDEMSLHDAMFTASAALCGIGREIEQVYDYLTALDWSELR